MLMFGIGAMKVHEIEEIRNLRGGLIIREHKEEGK